MAETSVSETNAPETSAPETPREAPVDGPDEAATPSVIQPLARPANPFEILDQKEVRGPRDVIITAVGDVSQPEKQWRETTEELKTRAFAPTQHLIDSADLAAMNLENPVSDLPPTAKKEFSFTSPPERLGWYMDVGFNIFSLSNNHIADADQIGIDDTLRHLKATSEAKGVEAFWAGASDNYADAEAYTLVTLPDKDVKIAFFSTGFSRSPNVSKFWSITLPAKIEAAKADPNIDLVIVSVHAGKEYRHVPQAPLVERFRSWVDAGADIVLGHHPHVVRPVEAYKRGLIFYSLGNFVFASRTRRHKKSGARMYGLITRIIVYDGAVAGAEVVPLWVNNAHDWVLETGERMPKSDFTPVPLTGPFVDQFFEDFNRWTDEIGATRLERKGDVGIIRVAPPTS
ncbi:MAG: CapA family protein [Myxococcota bacterium]